MIKIIKFQKLLLLKSQKSMKKERSLLAIISKGKTISLQWFLMNLNLNSFFIFLNI